MKKRVCALILTLCLMLALLPGISLPARAATSGSCGASLKWSYNTTTGVLSITGTGAMEDYYDGWDAYRDSIVSLSVASGATSIGAYAFYDCTKLTTVSMPSTVKTIGESAFTGCAALASINLASVATIGEYAFEACTALTTITIPATTTSIGAEAFAGCSAMTAFAVNGSNTKYAAANGVLFNKAMTTLIQYPAGKSGAYTIANTVTGIGEAAFRGCSKLTSVVIPDSVTSAGDDAFNGCKALTSVTLSKKMTSLGFGMFANCTALKTVDIPQGVKAIGSMAFGQCAALASVSIPQGVTTIGNSAFANCNGLTAVTLPDTVTSLGRGTFSGCVALESITLSQGLTTIGEGAFANCSALTNVGFPGKLQTIDMMAFATARSLANLSIPTSLTKVSDYAFSDCGGLKHVLYQGNQTQWKAIKFGTENTCFSTATVHYGATGDEVSIKQIDGKWCLYCTICAKSIATVPECKHLNCALQEDVEPTCEVEGYSGDLICQDCGTVVNKGYSIPALGHDLIDGVCQACGDTITVTPTGPVLDEAIVINHSLNLASDISINFAVRADLLTNYDSFHLECVLPVYEGNTLIDSNIIYIPGVLNGNYYYFTLEGLTAVNMNDIIQATLNMMKGTTEYVSKVDEYSIATYAYAQLKKDTTDAKLRTLCADLLRYGAYAQIFKGYRTNALCNSSMTADMEASLSNMAGVTFNNRKDSLLIPEQPGATVVGRSLELASKVVVKYIFTLQDSSIDVEDLTLRVNYTDYQGQKVSLAISGAEVYNPALGQYAFAFDKLLAAELRSVISCAIYEGDNRISALERYSVDTYCINKTGILGDLCKALISYSDSAKAYFT